MFYGSLVTKKLIISRKNKTKCLAFAKTYFSKPLDFWKSILRSDESKFELKSAKPTVWGKKGKPFDKKTIKATIKHGYDNVLGWGCFSYNGVGNLVQIEEKLKEAGYVNI